MDIQYKVKAIPVKAWTGPEGSRKVRVWDFKTIGTSSGKFVGPKHRSHLPRIKYSWYSFLLEAESTPAPQCGRNELYHLQGLYTQTCKCNYCKTRYNSSRHCTSVTSVAKLKSVRSAETIVIWCSVTVFYCREFQILMYRLPEDGGVLPKLVAVNK